MKHIPLYIITGFFGAGKTQFLTALLNSSLCRRAGVILNDAGPASIDASLLPEGPVRASAELTGAHCFTSGSIDLLVEAFGEFRRKGCDALFLETSGSAKPLSLPVLLKKLNAFPEISFRGMICVLDSQQRPLISGIRYIEQQAVYSDLFVVNGSREMEPSLLKLQPGASVIHTGDPDIIPKLLSMSPDQSRYQEISELRYLGQEKPKVLFMEPLDPVTSNGLEQFIRFAAPSCMRIKGLIHTREQLSFAVRTSGSSIEMKEVSRSMTRLPAPGLLVIQQPNGTGDRLFPSRWRLLTGGSLRITSCSEEPQLKMLYR